MGVVCTIRGISDRQISDLEADLYDDSELEDEGAPLLDLDKAWAGVHYLLKGGKPGSPLDFLSRDRRLFRSSEVQELQEALSSVTDDDLRRAFEPATMMRLKIYPEIWNEPGAFEYLFAPIPRLRAFLRALSERRSGMVVRFD